MAWGFYSQFDRIGLHWLLLGEIALLAAGLARLREFRRHILMFAAGMILFLSCGEIGFRLYYFGPAGLSFNNYRPAGYGHPHGNFEFDSSTYTGLKPSTRMSFRGRPFTTNSDGFRGPEIVRPKPPGVYRIVLAGASTCMGSGVGDDEVMTVVMERMLNSTGLPARVEVANVAVGGSIYGHQIHALRTICPEYDPDMIMFLANESISGGEMKIIPRKVRAYEGPAWRTVLDPKFNFLSSRFFFLQLMNLARRGDLVYQHMSPRQLAAAAAVGFAKKTRGSLTAEQFDEMAAGQKNVLEAMDLLKEIAGEAETVFYLLKPLEGSYDAAQAWRFRQFLRHFGEKKGVWIVDTYDLDYGAYDPRELFPYPGEKHPNEVVHRYYGEEMARQVLPIIRAGLEKRSVR